MLEFIFHPNFETEAAKQKKRFNDLMGDIKKFQRLCEIQFHPTNPNAIIAPGKLHAITKNALWQIWKIELVVTKTNLRPNQYPRVWFAVEGSKVAFLCIRAHMDNYNDNEIDRLALQRVADIF